MPKALLIRRKKLGYGSAKGLSACSGKIDWVRNDKLHTVDINDYTHVIRWGCTSTIPRKDDDSLPIVINKSDAIHRVNNKSGFRNILMNEDPEIVPPTWFNVLDDVRFPVIVRPQHHSRGRSLYFCSNNEELNNAAYLCSSNNAHYYISEYIPKVAEYRVYIVAGKVVSIAQKQVEDVNAIAWNRSRTGCEFVNVRFNNWPLAVADVATRAFSYSGLDFGGVDVMVGEDGRAYVIEINSACSLPLLQGDGPIHTRISYRQKVMAKCLEWLIEGKNPNYVGDAGYHQYIHAAWCW